jgi:hypothetical protein
VRSRRARAILGAAVAVGLLLPAPVAPSPDVAPIAAPILAPAPAAAATEAVPDLAMAPLKDFRIQWVGGRRMMRFTAMMVNIGSGHFEVRGHRTSTAQPMRVRQIIFTDTSRSTIARTIETDAEAMWSGDGHDHWHVQEMMRYDLWGSTGTTRGAKVGFCFLDSDPYRLSLPGAPSGPFYRGSWCGNDRNALENRMGISVGWGDEYEWYLAWQWVDITDIPSGTFTLRANVDPYGFFLEERENNQCAWARISWTASSSTVTLHDRGSTCPNDWSDSKFASAIAWLWQTGITVGCAPDLFCTNNLVRRDQMATFLTRALSLPPTSVDYYSDDNGNKHESGINRLAASGITRGCAPGRYCPKGIVYRDQMASFLARAFNLPPATKDHFDDDNGNKHEDAINRVAEAGITVGCGERRYCPKSGVTRGQLAAFLRRAMSN